MQFVDMSNRTVQHGMHYHSRQRMQIVHESAQQRRVLKCRSKGRSEQLSDKLQAGVLQGRFLLPGMRHHVVRSRPVPIGVHSLCEWAVRFVHQGAFQLKIHLCWEAVRRRRLRLDLQHRLFRERRHLLSLQYFSVPERAVPHSVHCKRGQPVQAVRQSTKQRGIYQPREPG